MIFGPVLIGGGLTVMAASFVLWDGDVFVAGVALLLAGVAATVTVLSEDKARRRYGRGRRT